MLELIKRLIKWIIIVILFIILIIFIVGLVKKADSSKNTKVYKPVVQTIKDNAEEDYNNVKNNVINKNNDDNNVEVYQNDNQAELPDTASPRDSLLIIIGTIVLGSGCFYIYKNRNITD